MKNKHPPDEKHVGGLLLLHIVINFYAKDLDKMFEITIDGATVKYSVMSYAYSVISRPSSYTSDMIDVVKAMCLYSEAAEIYTSGNAQEG